MKNFRAIFTTVFFLSMTLGLTSCKKCKNEDPSARIFNNGNIKASVQIQTSNGNTVNINNIQPGASSDYASYAPGICKFTVSVGSTNVVETVEMFECFNYDILIASDNDVTTVAYDLND